MTAEKTIELRKQVASIAKHFGFSDMDAFDYWVEQGCPLFEDYPDDARLIRGKDGYRLKTGLERWRERARAMDRARRFRTGEMQGMERAVYQMQVDMVNSILNRETLLIHMLEPDDR